MYSSSKHRIKEIVTFVNREGEDLSLGGYVCKEGSVALSWSDNDGGRVEGDRNYFAISAGPRLIRARPRSRTTRNCAETERGSAKSERWLGAETRERLPTGQSHRDLCVLIPRRTFIYWLSLQDIATDFVTVQLFHISYPIHILFFVFFFLFLVIFFFLSFFCDFFFYLGKYYFI